MAAAHIATLVAILTILAAFQTREAAAGCEGQLAKGVNTCINFTANPIIIPESQLKSPFRDRIVHLGNKVSQSYQFLCEWVFGSITKKSEILFEWGDQFGDLEDFTSMRPNEYITNTIIDIWTMILNDNEKYREDTYTKSRFYATTATTIYSTKDYGTREERVAIFKSNFNADLNRFPRVNVQRVNLFFFPVLHRSHFFVVCFEMNRGAIDVLDNSAKKIRFSLKYGNTVKNLRYNFFRYLKEIKHPRMILLYKVIPKRLEMSWRTHKNGVDCGIFAMRHMETYTGGGTKSWTCDLDNESEMQTKQLLMLRELYLNNIIRSDMNAKMNEVLEHSDEWRMQKQHLKTELAM